MRVSKHVGVDATFIELLPSLFRNEIVEVRKLVHCKNYILIFCLDTTLKEWKIVPLGDLWNFISEWSHHTMHKFFQSNSQM